jgi:hypothetical protein
VDGDVLDRLDAAAGQQERLEAMAAKNIELRLELAERLGVDDRPALRLIEDGQESSCRDGQFPR